MGLKFRKRIKVMPGLTLNISKSGISTTIGTKGLSVNVGKNGAYLNTGIPGTGIYDRTRLTPSYKQINRVAYSNNEYHNINYDQILSFFVKRSKKRVKATWLALLTGFVGGHKFYLGKKWQGILYVILLFVGGISILLSIIDVLYLSLISDETFLLKYNKNMLDDLGITKDILDKNPDFYDKLIRNGSRYRHNGGFAATVIKLALLALLGVFVFVSIVSHSENKNSNKSILSETFKTSSITIKNKYYT